MTQYSVIWWQAADDELLRIWLESPDRSQITDASREIDRVLASRGVSAGEPVHEGLYAINIGLLRVQYSVEEDDRIVRVWTVRLKTLRIG